MSLASSLHTGLRTECMNIHPRQARKRGLKAIIAGAGGAAHVPGMVAAMTTVPVIGVPIQAKALDGMDALLYLPDASGNPGCHSCH